MNVCIFSGRLTNDAKGRNTEGGKFVASYSIAVPVGWGNQKKTIFVNCTHWNCEKLLQYLVKGAAVTIRGQYNEREYTKDGEQKRFHEIIVAELEFQRGGEKKEETKSKLQEEFFEDDQAIPF